LFFALYEDLLVFANDDVLLQFDTLERMEAAAAADNAFLLFAETDPWSFFLLKKRAYLDTGPFDPAFWPIYWEDIDYHRRLALGGYHPVTVTGARIDHVGSATLRAYDDAGRRRHDARFLRNQALYERKWGGTRDLERFTVPYDGRPANIPPLIDKEP
jgi:GT2 family glycosyltransferase